jgi:hypothetical protein
MATRTERPPTSSTVVEVRSQKHFTREGRAWSELSGLGAGRYRLRLGGPFLSGWLSGLCARLAEHALSIEQAHAWVSRDGTWVAELTFARPDSGQTVDAASLSYLSFVASTEASVELQPQLDSARLERTPENGGSLLLALEAPDSLGLLGAVLGTAAKLGAFPLEMHIDTRAGRADDRIWFADKLGRMPTAEVEAAFRAWLEGLVRS